MTSKDICVCVRWWVYNLAEPNPRGGGGLIISYRQAPIRVQLFFITIVTHVIIKHCATIET